MAKEYDTLSTTPENAGDKIEAFLKEATVGSVDYIAFNDAFEWERATNTLHHYQRGMEVLKSTGEIPHGVILKAKSRTGIESELRQAEIRRVLAEMEMTRNASHIPGYTPAFSYFSEMLRDFQEDMVKTEKFDEGDPELSRIRSRDEALDIVGELTSEVEHANPNIEDYWLIQYLKNLK